MAPAPGLITNWDWNDDKTGFWVEVREGVKWHNGDDFGQRMLPIPGSALATPNGSPLAQTWGNIRDIQIEGNRITAKMMQFDPMMFRGCIS